MARLLIIAGLVMLGAGLLLYLVPHVPWIGRLPGDVRVERPGFSLYVPITTSIIASLVISLVLWLLARWRG